MCACREGDCRASQRQIMALNMCMEELCDRQAAVPQTGGNFWTYGPRRLLILSQEVGFPHKETGRSAHLGSSCRAARLVLSCFALGYRGKVMAGSVVASSRWCGFVYEHKQPAFGKGRVWVWEASGGFFEDQEFFRQAAGLSRWLSAVFVCRFLSE